MNQSEFQYAASGKNPDNQPINGEFIALAADKLILESVREKGGKAEIQNVI